MKHNGIYYDTGPRSFRPVGLSGLNALDLMEEIGLDNKVLYISKSHPVSKNRMIFTKGKLVRLPTDLSMLFKTTPPFERPLLRAILRDIVTRRYVSEQTIIIIGLLYSWIYQLGWIIIDIFPTQQKGNDDSIYNFIERRFGSDIATYGIDPLIRGICAGDARRISVKFSMAKLFEYEQKYGSVVLGYLMSRFRDKPTKIDEFVEIPGHKAFGMSNIGMTSFKESWALWGLENGTETLIDRMEQVLEDEMDVQIIRDANVDSIQFPDDPNSNTAVIHYENSDRSPGSHPCDFIISALPSWSLASILRRSKPSHPTLSQLLETIEGVDVIVTSVLYNDPTIVKEDGFGFLVPSNEVQNTPAVEGLLGVVYDTCIFDQGEDATIFTVISKPPQKLSQPPSNAAIEKMTMDYLKTTLGITRVPDHMNIKYSPQCIPQYSVGHSEKVDAAKRFIKAAKLPLLLSGASFEGVSVNDCIYSGRRASENLPFEEP